LQATADKASAELKAAQRKYDQAKAKYSELKAEADKMLHGISGS
jgi:hypothetical protein